MRKLSCAMLIVVVMGALSLPAWAAASAPPRPPGVGDKIVDFELRDLQKRKIPTAKARKGKIFLLKFGATWCGWCNKQAPHLNTVVKAYRKKVLVLDVDVKEDARTVKKHNKRLGAKFLTVLDPMGMVAARYGVSGIPVVIIADKDGNIVYRGNYTDFSQLKTIIDGLLKKEKEEEAARKAAAKAAQ